MSTMFAEQLARVEAKVHKYVAENRVRLESFFVVYDRLRHRHITRAQFFRGLNAAMNNTLLLSLEEEAAVVDKYGRSDGMINYRAFSDNCTMIQRDLEKSPWAEVRNDHQSTNMRRNQLSPGEEKYFYSMLLPKLQHISREQGLVVKNAYQDFDHNKNGCVTKMQFLRGLPDKFQIACSRSDLEMLVDRYSLPDAYGTGVDVSYHTMHIDISLEDSALTLPDGRLDDIVEAAPAGRIPVLSQLERRVRQVCRDKQFNMVPFFQDFDKLRTGFISCKVFTRVLCSLGLEYLAGDLDVLAALYQSDQHKDNWVDYKLFCREMQTPSSSTRSILQDLFDRVRREFSTRGAVGLTGLLQALTSADQRRQGKLPLSTFEDSLRACGISVTAAESDAIFGHFANNGNVDYMAFVREVRGSLHRLRRQVVLQVFRSCFTDVSTVNMEVLMRNFQFQYHPRCLEGSLSQQQCVADVEEGISLNRNGSPTTEDLLDYWAFTSYKLSEEQFEYCVVNTFP
jgi:Ca2+-binding EF-hand superfamily protein